MELERHTESYESSLKVYLSVNSKGPHVDEIKVLGKKGTEKTPCLVCFQICLKSELSCASRTSAEQDKKRHQAFL